MDNLAFLSVCFDDERYKEQQVLLRASIQKYHPASEMYFWTDDRPPGSRQHDFSYYGFKPHAVQYALDKGHTKIIWCDTAIKLVSRVDEYFDLVKEYGVVAAQDDNLLCNHCGKLPYQYFGITKEESREQKQHLVGGSIYVFDFDLPLCREIFDRWIRAERDGMFGMGVTAHTLAFYGHRHDEAIMALSLYASGSKPCPYELARYNNVSNPIVIKEHFK